MKKTLLPIRKAAILLLQLLAFTSFQQLKSQSNINGSSVQTVGTSYTDTGDGSMRITLPNSTQNGDVTFLFMGQSDSGSLKFPSGWNEITNWGRPGNYNDINLKIAYFVYKGGTKTFSIGSHKKSLVYAITLRGVDQNNPIIDDWTKNDTNNKYLNGDRGGCNRGSDGRAVAKSELTSKEDGLHFVAAMYDDPQRDVKIYTNDRYNREVMTVLRSWHYEDDGLTIALEATNGQTTDNRYFKGNTCRGGNAEGVVASFTIKPSGSTQVLDYDNDGIPDSTDTDDDNDGQSDVHENACGSNPRDTASTSPDTDNDNTPNCIDTDDDNDGQSDVHENACGSDPNNANSISPDADGDNIPNCKDPDYENNTPNDQTWIIDNCDNLSNWSSQNASLTLSSNFKEGLKSLKSIGNRTPEFYKSFAAKNMTGATTLEFWYYISSKDGLLDANQVEIGSGGRNDRNEYHWSINKNDLQVGWNQIKLNIKDAGTTGGQPDLSKLNWFRLYRKKTRNITTRIDYIRMTNGNSKIIDVCDTIDGWSSSNTALVVSSTLKEGTASLKSTGNRTNEFYKSFSQKDMTGTTTLEFWYYISSKNGLLDANQVEIGSGGRNDRNEYHWNINKNDLQVGWNAIKLNLSDASTTGGQPDLSKLNWFRLYRKKSSTVTTRIDFIRMTNNQNNIVRQVNKEYKAPPKHELYPNPSRGEINLSILIDTPNTKSSIYIKNMVGKTVYKKEINGLPAGLQQINISNLKLSPAMYIAEIKTYKSKKVIKFLVID